MPFRSGSLLMIGAAPQGVAQKEYRSGRRGKPPPHIRGHSRYKAVTSTPDATITFDKQEFRRFTGSIACSAC